MLSTPTSPTTTPTLIRRALGLTALAAAVLIGAPRAAEATGEIRTPGGGRLDLTSHDVQVEIVDQVAVTKVKQVFHNAGSTKVEGTYLFPLPKGAQLIRFRATVGGEIREGIMKEKEQARREYQAAKAAGAEAALAESTPEGAFTVALANIAPNAAPTVELEYIQLCSYDTGMVAYTYPLKPKGGKASPAGLFTFHCDVSSLVPITLAYSNSHRVDVTRGTHAAAVHLQKSDYTATEDLHLAYHVKRGQTGMDVRLHRAAGADHGYALIAMTPSAELLSDEVIAKDITFVVDVSGSMKGQKIIQERKALEYCIRALRPRDRFNIVTFSFSAHRLWDAPRHATAAAVREGVAVAKGLVANGGTNIGDAMVKALKDGAPQQGEEATVPHVVVFLTDGKASSGETDPAKIVDIAKDHMQPNSRVFTFGIGRDLNHFLLRQIAKHSKGAAAFVTQEHELELAISTFQQRIASPVLTDITIEAEGARISQIYPKNVSFLFHGDQLLVAAKFHGQGPGALRITANAKGERKTFELPLEWPAVAEETPVLGRLWALKKMQYLLDEVQLRGSGPSQELVKEITALSLEYTVASPYTSFLVIDPNAKVETTDERPNEPAESEGKKLEELKKLQDKSKGRLRRFAGGSRGAPKKDAAPGGPATGSAPAQGGKGGGWGGAPKSKSGPGGLAGARPSGRSGPGGPSNSPAAPSGGPTAPGASGGTAPAPPAAPAVPAPAAKPNADPSAQKSTKKFAKRAQDRKSRNDAPQDAAPDMEEDELDDDVREAERAAAGRVGEQGANAWFTERLKDGALSLADRIDLALTLEASGECRGFGPHADWIGALCDALTVDAVAKLPLGDRIRAAIVRVESYRLSGLASERAAAQQLLDHVGAALGGAAGQSLDTDLAILARQSRNAGLAMPDTLTAHLTAAAKGSLLVKLMANAPSAADKAAAQSAQAGTADRLERALLAALAELEFDTSNLWEGQDPKTGATGSSSETLRRLRAVNASYWISQGPK